MLVLRPLELNNSLCAVLKGQGYALKPCNWLLQQLSSELSDDVVQKMLDELFRLFSRIELPLNRLLLAASEPLLEKLDGSFVVIPELFRSPPLGDLILPLLKLVGRKQVFRLLALAHLVSPNKKAGR